MNNENVKGTMRVLVVEDDRSAAFDLKADLSDAGHEVDIALDGESALVALGKGRYEAVVLDVMIPRLNGFEVLAHMRGGNDFTPVIVLSALSTYDDRVKGLGVGADDYLTKPYGIEELLARLDNITRRYDSSRKNEIVLDDLVIDLFAREVTRNGEEIFLRPREYKLLITLAQAPGRIFTKDQLHKHVWGYDFDPQTNLIRVAVARLREQVDRNRKSPLIETIHGVGYRIRENATIDS